MFNKESFRKFLVTHTKSKILTLLFFVPAILSICRVSLPSHYRLLNGIILLPGGLNYAFAPAFTAAYVAGPLAGLIFLILTPIVVYAIARIICALWDRVFDNLFGKRSIYFQLGVVIIIISVFIYYAVIIPERGNKAVSIRIDIPTEININKDYYPAYNSAGEDISDIHIFNMTIRNDSDYKIIYDMPEKMHICYYDIESGVTEEYLAPYGSDQAIEWAAPQDLKIVLQPHSEVKLYRYGFRDFSRDIMVEKYRKYANDFDEFLLVSASLSCRDLTAEQIANAKRIKILR